MIYALAQASRAFERFHLSNQTFRRTFPRNRNCQALPGRHPLHRPSGGPPPPFSWGRMSAAAALSSHTAKRRGRGTTRGVVEGASLGVPPNQGAAARRLAAEASAAETVPGYALPKWVRT
jgi:hypothetical protein